MPIVKLSLRYYNKLNIPLHRAIMAHYGHLHAVKPQVYLSINDSSRYHDYEISTLIFSCVYFVDSFT